MNAEPLAPSNIPSLGLAALNAALRGWAVFPCQPSGPDAKAPIAAAVPHGHKDATRDPEVITRWWTRWPNAMIGAPVPDSLLVLDVDPRNGGSLEALEIAAGQRLPETLTVWSGRGDGGRHLYYLRPALRAFTSTRLPVGVDLKVRGYCILPPSIHPATGMPYRWDARGAVSLPSGVRRLLVPPLPRLPRLQAGGGHDGLVGFIAGQGEGNRNKALFWAACRAGERGVLGTVAGELIAAAVAAGETPAACRRTVNSAAGRFGLGVIA